MLNKITDMIDNMKASHKLAIKIAFGLVCAGVLILIFSNAEASDRYPIQPPEQQVENVTSINYSSGLSDNDVADIVSGSLAGGAHQFSPLTTHWQFSVTGATSTSNFDEDTNFSFAGAYRFGKKHWMPNALYHVGFSPDIQDEDYVFGGFTVILDE